MIRSDIQKVARYVGMYGVRRTAFKVFGRIRPGRLSLLWASRKKREIGIIGCGQFAFATIGYVLWTFAGRTFQAAYDPSTPNLKSLARFYAGCKEAESAEEVIDDAAVRVVYIASNHASHSDYACRAMAAGKDVFVEKPVAVTSAQLERLKTAAASRRGRLFAGYNRPHSPAITTLRAFVGSRSSPFALSCQIWGFPIAADHWYRHPEEGTRICGNLGHWIDLAFHIAAWGPVARVWQITCCYADVEEPDDNISVVMVSEHGDFVTIAFTSRTEPFEGITETISLQCGDVLAKIDNFQSMTLWRGPSRRRFRYWPKDEGHIASICQPFRKDSARAWEEILMSAEVTLFIKDMVTSRQNVAVFTFNAAARDERPMPAE